MTYSSNLPNVLQDFTLKLLNVQRDEMTRLQATSLLAIMKDRIHVQGLDSNGAPIGTYTPEYVRYTRNSTKYKRGTDTKVILSLTRQLESGYQIEKIDNGYAISLRTAEDMQKANWCEETYKKPIFAPTAEEWAKVKEIAKEYIAKALG